MLSRPRAVQMAEAYARELAQHAQEKEIVICPSFVALPEIAKMNTGLKLGGQDAFWENEGKFTGEISPADLQDLGCSYCILGHSERRAHLGEGDEAVSKKARACLAAGLVPIVCVGENWEERNAGQRDVRLIEQVHSSFQGLELSSASKLVIAYEPIWAIGSGKSIEPADAFQAADLIRHTLLDFFSQAEVDASFTIIYGGSVDGSSAKSFVSHESIGGVLVGTASYEGVDSFKAVVENI